jgi:hypothetical protein
MNFCLQEFTHACGHHPLHAAPDGLSIENKGTDSMGRSLLFRCCAYQFPKFRTADTPFRNDLTQALVTQKHVFIENRTEAVMLATATTNHSHTCFLYAYCPAIAGIRLLTMESKAGPSITIKTPGKMKSTIGTIILIASLAACSSARCLRLVRRESENVRRA